jgi:hypothetical protein
MVVSHFLPLLLISTAINLITGKRDSQKEYKKNGDKKASVFGPQNRRNNTEAEHLAPPPSLPSHPLEKGPLAPPSSSPDQQQKAARAVHWTHSSPD